MENFRRVVEEELVRLQRQVAALEAYLCTLDGGVFPISEKTPVQRKPKPRGGGGRRKLPPLGADIAEKAVGLYQEGNGASKIAAVLQVNRHRVRKALKERGIQMRGQKEGIRLAKALKQRGKASPDPDSNDVVGTAADMTMPSDRNCLKCNKKFKSEGIHNRICPRCARVPGPPSYARPVNLTRKENFE